MIVVTHSLQSDESRPHEPARSSAGFDDFFRAQYLKLGKTLYLLAGSRSEAEDLAQEAFVKVYARWERVQQMESPEGYLYQVAINTYRKSLRPRRPSVVPLEDASVDAADDTSWVETKVDLLRILQHLPSEQREALVLVEWLGLDSAAASSLLGIASASVRGRLYRARRTLRKHHESWEV